MPLKRITEQFRSLTQLPTARRQAEEARKQAEAIQRQLQTTQELQRISPIKQTTPSLSDEEVRKIHQLGFSTIGIAPEREKTPISQTIRQQQRAMEELTQIRDVRIPFAKEKTFKAPADLQKIVISHIAARVPELLVQIPVNLVNFFRKNINTIIAGEPIETEQFRNILGFDPRRFGITDDIMEDTFQALMKQHDIEEQRNPSDGNKIKAVVNAAKAVSKTVVPDVIDALIGFDITKLAGRGGLELTRYSARQLPDSLLFKIQQSQVPLDKLVGTLTGAETHPIAFRFIQGLSASERKELFTRIRELQRIGTQDIPIRTGVEPTTLGRFARATPPGAELPPRISGFLPAGRASSGQAGFIDPQVMGEEFIKLARQSKSVAEFSRKLTPNQRSLLVARGLTPESFFSAVADDTPLIQEARKYKSAEEFVRGKYNLRDLDYPKMDLALDRLRANPQVKVNYVEGFPGSKIQPFIVNVTDPSGKARLITSQKQLTELADEIGVTNNTLYQLAKGDTKAPFVGINTYNLPKTDIGKLKSLSIDSLPDNIAGVRLGNKAGFQQALDDVVAGRLSKTAREPIEIKDGELIQGYHRFVEKLQTGGEIKANEFSTKSQLTDIWNKAQKATPQPFEGAENLTTKFLESIRGKTQVSKQEILNFANRPELKKGEADLLRRVGNELPDGRYLAQEVANQVEQGLLPLKPVRVKEPQYSNVHIERSMDEVMGYKPQGKNYEEVVFESPITTNGSSHYPNSKNYFAHARGDEVVEKGKKIWREQEIQSDLLQKEGLERAREVFKGGITAGEISLVNPEVLPKKFARRDAELAQLQPFTNDRYGERILRERIREKVIKGYDKYRLPTGETIGKIEGFQQNTWRIDATGDIARKVDDLKVGMQVTDANASQEWIITDILGGGRFKAVPKNVDDARKAWTTVKDTHTPPSSQTHLAKNSQTGEITQHPTSADADRYIEQQIKRANEQYAETFDLTGKSNPQYRRYENWGKFLKNKFGGKEITDPQGNTWFEVDLNKGLAQKPVEAFGVVAGFEVDEEGEIGFDPMKAALGVAGFALARGGKGRLPKKKTPPTPPRLEIVPKTGALSLHFEKTKENFNAFGESVGFNRITIKDQADKAFDFINRNPTKSMRVAYGLEDAPADIFQESVQAAIVESLRSAGKEEIAKVVAKKFSLSLTDSAQKLNIAKLDLGSAGERRIEGIILDERLKKIGAKLPKGPGELSPRERALGKLKADAKKASAETFEDTAIGKAEGILAEIKITDASRSALSEAFTKENITIQKLYDMTSKQRRDLFSKYVENATEINATFEKAMVSNQKQAMSNWAWKNLYEGKSLYAEVQIEQAQKMFNAKIGARDLKKLSPDERIKRLSEFVGLENAQKLNTRFETAVRSNTLANWEERTIGTKELFENQKLTQGLSRINALDELGVLTPKNAENFMEDLVSLKLGLELTPTEAKQLAELSRGTIQAFEKVGNNWLYTNKDSVVDYFVKRRALEDFIKKMSPDTAIDVFTSIGARGAILFSVRSAMNSLMFQIIPGITRTITKRIISPFLIPGEFKTIDRIHVALSGLKPDFARRKFWRNQGLMGVEIYRKTSYDFSRMQTLEDGFRYFGEKITRPVGPSWGESVGVVEKMGALVRGHARLMEPGLKYAAGGTDAIFANFHRGGTTALLARQRALLEEKAGILPSGMTRADREMQIIQESYSFNPRSVEAQYIREAGILDAHHANFTTNDFYGKIALRFRNAIPQGIGKTIAPFAKIPANALGKGFEATGPGLIRGLQQLIKATRMADGAARNNAISEAIAIMATAGGVFGAALFITSLLDNDDFIQPYDFTKRSDNQLSITKNAGANYIRIGGKWINLRWTGPFSIPISAIMTARQNKAGGKSASIGYMKGVGSGLLEFPVVKEFLDVGKTLDGAIRTDTWNDFARSAGLDLDSMRRWMQVRTIPSIISHDVQGLIDETKYDAFGRPLPEKSFINFIVGANIKQDKSNIITEEFDRLNITGNIPTLTNPTGEHIDFLEFFSELVDESFYINFLNERKFEYANKVLDLIATKRYSEMSDADKKKEIDKIRRDQILEPLRKRVEAIKRQIPEAFERFEIEKSPSSATDDRNPFQLLRDYIKGTLRDPGNVARALFTKEKLGKVEGNLVELQRDFGEPYLTPGGGLNPRGAEYARREMAREMGIPIDQLPEFRREHIVPVSAGGSNADSNLQLIPKDLHDAYTPMDIVAGRAVREGRMTRRQVEDIMIRVKVDNTMSIQEAMRIIQSR